MQTAWPASGLARDLEDRKRDVEPAAQVHVAVGVLLEQRVAGRLERLDQPVLEHERAELGLGRLVVDVLGLPGPRRRRREVRPRARAQADRLADVQRVAVGVAEDVDARVLGERAEVGPLVTRPLRPDRLEARRLARGRSDRSASAIVRAFAHSRGSSAHSTRAHVSASGSARCVWLDLDPERVGERGEPAAALQRREPARERDRAQHRRVRPFELGALERLLEHADVEARVVRDEQTTAQLLGERRQHVGRRRRLVDHLLRDPGEALDAAAERLRHADQRAPALVQLAAADQHGADLGQLAALLRLPVGLRVDGEELGLGDRGVEEIGVGHGPRVIRLQPDGHARRVCSTFAACVGWREPSRSRSSQPSSAGCGSEADYANKPRPPAPISVTAAIDTSRVRVSRAVVRRRAGRVHHLEPVRRGPEGDVRERRAGRVQGRDQALDRHDRAAVDRAAEGRCGGGQLHAERERRPRRRPRRSRSARSAGRRRTTCCCRSYFELDRGGSRSRRRRSSA